MKNLTGSCRFGSAVRTGSRRFGSRGSAVLAGSVRAGSAVSAIRAASVRGGSVLAVPVRFVATLKEQVLQLSVWFFVHLDIAVGGTSPIPPHLYLKYLGTSVCPKVVQIVCENDCDCDNSSNVKPIH